MLNPTTPESRREMSPEQRLERVQTALDLLCDDLRHLQPVFTGPEVRHDMVTAVTCVERARRAVGHVAEAANTVEARL